MAIILSAAADLVHVRVVYHSSLPTEFTVILRGSMFVQEVNAAMRANTLALQGIAEGDNQAAGIAITAARAEKAASEADPWRRQASPEQCLLDSSIVGWQEVQDEAGNEIPFAKEQLRQLLEPVGMDMAIYTACSARIREINEKNSTPLPTPPPAAPSPSQPTQ